LQQIVEDEAVEDGVGTVELCTRATDLSKVGGGVRVGVLEEELAEYGARGAADK